MELASYLPKSIQIEAFNIGSPGVLNFRVIHDFVHYWFVTFIQCGADFVKTNHLPPVGKFYTSYNEIYLFIGHNCACIVTKMQNST